MIDRNSLKFHFSFGFKEDYEEKTPLVTLDSNNVYELGSLTRENAKDMLPSYESLRGNLEFSVVVDVSTADGHSLFRSAVSPGTSAINDWSIVENRKAAISYGCSSYVLQEEVKYEQISSSPKQISRHLPKFRHYGGAVPIFIEGVHFPVACLTIDGNNPEYDHYIAMRSLQQFAKRQRDERQKVQTREQQQRDEEIARQVSNKLEEEKNARRLDGGAWELFHPDS